METFLEQYELPRLSDEQANILDAPLTPEEFPNALEKKPNNKSPRPDGFPVEFYKHFWQILSLLFHKVTTEITAIP